MKHHDMTVSPYVDLLMARQSALGETDAQFAARFGFDRETWRQIRQGRDPSVRTLRQILAVYPDLLHAVMLFLAGENASIATESPIIKALTRRRRAS